MLTVETITDADIEPLSRDPELKIRVLALAAMRIAYTAAQKADVRSYRARCAEILNLRAKSQAI